MYTTNPTSVGNAERRSPTNETLMLMVAVKIAEVRNESTIIYPDTRPDPVHGDGQS